MLSRFLPTVAVLLLLASCSTMQPVILANKQAPPKSSEKKEVRFLDISSDRDSIEVRNEHHSSGTQSVKNESDNSSTTITPEIEKASSLQLKYSELLNTEVEQVKNISLYQNIDDWYGVPYKLGGTSKKGIDCSAFVQTIFISAFGVTLPRTAKDQYNSTRRVSQTELREGDLLFFNTRGGVSHVGIYLQNNKFVHASVSGVTISDMFEPYYLRHFVAAGRIKQFNNSSASVKP